MPIRSEERFARVVKLLLSVNDSKVAGYLAKRGFSEEDRAEGWELFDKATRRHVGMQPLVSNGLTQELITRIDAWENVWFDVASAALGRKFPKVHDALFLNIGKSSGADVIVGVKTLLDRLDALEAEGGEQAKGALALLDKRGLTLAVREQARKVLFEATSSPLRPEPPVELEQAKQDEQAIEAMWAWYKDWATTARTVVTPKALRIRMGVSRARSSEPSDEVVIEKPTEPAGLELATQPVPLKT